MEFATIIYVQFRRLCVQASRSTRVTKNVWDDFSNIAILTKSATPGEVQLTLVHTTVGKKILVEFVAAFALSGSLGSPHVVSININISFVMDSNKIRFPIAEVILREATGNLARSNKQQDWAPRNDIFLPPFFMEAEILNRETSA